MYIYTKFSDSEDLYPKKTSSDMIGFGRTSSLETKRTEVPYFINSLLNSKEMFILEMEIRDL